MSVRIAEDHTAHIYLEDADNAPEMWTDASQSPRHRKRFQPTCIAVEWRRTQTRTLNYLWGDWKMVSLVVYGNYLRKGSESRTLSLRYQDGDRNILPIDPWITELIKQAHPMADCEDWYADNTYCDGTAKLP